MTEDEKDEIFSFIKEIEDLKAERIIASVFPGEDLDSKTIGDFSANQFLAYLKKMLSQFKNRLRQPDYHLLPTVLSEKYDEMFSHRRNNGRSENVTNLLSELKDNLNSPNLKRSASILSKLCFYQIITGFWNQDIAKYHPIEEDQLSQIQKRLELLTAQTEEINNIQKKQLKELEETLEKNSNHLSSIDKNASIAMEQTEQIDSYSEKAVRADEKLKIFVEGHETHVEKVKKSLNEWSTRLQDLEAKGNRLVSEIEGTKEAPGLLSELKVNLTKSNEELSFFSETHEYLDQLLANAVGASLFETFANRKKELNNPVRNWTWITIGMVLGAVVWIYLVFSNIWILGNGPEGWIGFALDSLKVLPVLFLVGFAVDRFRRERKYQEEYAFKSAVALTIKGYVDLLETTENKEKMILDSVEGLYRSPVQHRRKKGNETDALAKLIKDSPELLTKIAAEAIKKVT